MQPWYPADRLGDIGQLTLYGNDAAAVHEQVLNINMPDFEPIDVHFMPDHVIDANAGRHGSNELFGKRQGPDGRQDGNCNERTPRKDAGASVAALSVEFLSCLPSGVKELLYLLLGIAGVMRSRQGDAQVLASRQRHSFDPAVAATNTVDEGASPRHLEGRGIMPG